VVWFSQDEWSFVTSLSILARSDLSQRWETPYFVGGGLLLISSIAHL